MDYVRFQTESERNMLFAGCKNRGQDRFEFRVHLFPSRPTRRIGGPRIAIENCNFFLNPRQ